MPLLVHIVAGGIAIVSGFVALFAAKGAGLHRRSGLLFVVSMGMMAGFGAGIAVFRGQPGNVIAGLLTGYLVVSALNTVRSSTAPSRRVDAAAMLVALATGLAGITLAADSLVNGDGTRDGVPAAVFLVFGAIALLSGLSDVRMMRSGGLRGSRRLARHLWRMCLALFIASGSFFLGQADEFPEALRIPALLAVPALLPLLLMAFWLWRVRARRTAGRLVAARAASPRAPVPRAMA